MTEKKYYEIKHSNETDNYYITFRNKNRRVFHTFKFTPNEFVEFMNDLNTMYFATDLYAEPNNEVVE